MHCKIIVCLFVTTSFVIAQDNQPVLIDNSRSPDGRMELWIKSSSNQGEAIGTAQIRMVKTGKIAGTFKWSGFGYKAGHDAFTVLWRPDSKCFAISWEESKGWMTGSVYAFSENKRWVEVKFPTEQYGKAIKKLSGASALRGKGCDTPEKWLPNDQLVVNFADEGILYDDVDAFKEYEVTLRVYDEKNTPLQVARIISIRLKPRDSQ